MGTQTDDFGFNHHRYGVEHEGWREAIASLDKSTIERRDAATAKAADAWYNNYRGLLENINNETRSADMEKNNKFSALARIASENGGFVPRSLLGAVSRDFGVPIAAMGFNPKDGSFVTMGHKTDANGNAIPGNTELLDLKLPEEVLASLQRSKTAPELQSRIYKGLTKRYTVQELQDAGFTNPDLPVVGQTTDGKAMSALAGRVPSRHSRISFFASDGQGGGTRSTFDGFTGERTEEQLGNRADGTAGRWKVRVNGPDGKVYENSKTGEEITVKPGENLRDVLMKIEKRGGSGVEIAKINADSREKVAGIKADASKESAKTYSDAKKYVIDKKGGNPKEQVEALKGMLELARTSDMSEGDFADLKSWTNELIKGMAGMGGETSGDGGTEPPKSDNVSESEKKRIMESKVGTIFRLRGKKYVRTDDEAGFKLMQ